jgi:hypothetical protein
MYWQELVLTKIDECYVRRYSRDYTRSFRFLSSPKPPISNKTNKI